MIGSLRGQLLERSGDEVLVEVNGVGYWIAVTPEVVSQLGELGGEVFVHVYHHVREDAETLYGFLTGDQRRVFISLLSTHGVGPSMAQAILAVYEPDRLRQVLADDDVAALCLVPGVGKKTAARLLVELKSKLDVPVGDVAAAVAAGSDQAPSSGSTARRDVREALGGLGYSDVEVAAVMRELPDDDDVSSLLKEALRRLSVSV